MAVNGPDGYTILISPNRGSCIMLSLPGVYCVGYWHVFLGCVVRFTLSVFVDDDEEHDE